MKRAPVLSAGLGLVTLVLVGLVALVPGSARAADGYLGVHIQDIDETLAAALDLDQAQGVLVNEVVDESPAAKAGLQRGDLILTLDGRDAVDSRRFTRNVRRLDAGEAVELTILRKGKPMKLEVTLGEVPDDERFGRLPGQVRSENGDLMWLDRGNPRLEHAPNVVFRTRGGRLGVNVHGLDADLGRYFGTEEGALVLGVQDDSAAEQAGLKPGDVIVSIDGEPVEDAMDLHELVAGHEPGERIAVGVFRDRKEQSLDVELGEDLLLQRVHDLRGPHTAPRVFHLEAPPHLEGRDDLEQELQALRARLERLEEQLDELEN